MPAQAVVLAFLALYVLLTGWRLQRRLGLYLVALYVLSQVPSPHSDFLHAPRVKSFASLRVSISLPVIPQLRVHRAPNARQGALGLS